MIIMLDRVLHFIVELNAFMIITYRYMIFQKLIFANFSRAFKPLHFLILYYNYYYSL